MTITCGITHLVPMAEQIAQALRASSGYQTSGGCGREIDLTNPIQIMDLYRCRECARWLCGPCLDRHFAETSDHILAAGGSRV